MNRKQFFIHGIVHFLIVLVIIAADQLTKVWARNTLADHSIIMWDKVFAFRLVYNTGGPWGMLGNHTIVLTILSALIFIGILVLYVKMPNVKRMLPLRLCVALICAGAIGNMIDRIWFQKVTDMISFDLINFPVFNVADTSVVCGCILAVLLTIFYYKDEDFQWKK